MSDYDERLERLAVMAGIAPSYLDFYGLEHFASLPTKQRLLTAMGLPVGDDEQLRQSYDRVENDAWRRLIPPVAVRKIGTTEGIRFIVPAERPEVTLAWRIALEDGSSVEGRWQSGLCALHEYREVDGRRLDLREGLIGRDLPMGYHTLYAHVEGEDAEPTSLSLIVVPERCYLPPALEGGEKLFGLAVQLYSLREADDWGTGDFGTLRKFALGLANSGVGLLGLNPLHELSPIDPDAASPYSPSSRLTLNPVYIDMLAVPEMIESEELRALYYAPDMVVSRARAREREVIDFGAINAAKRRLLEACFRYFRDEHQATESPRGLEFERYLEAGGATLLRLCAFHALAEHFYAQGLTSWRAWPEAYRDVNSAETRAYTDEHTEKIHFFAYVQWETERQLSRAQEACGNMRLGLYSDLAVGVDGNSGDTWARPELFAQGVGVGAPPDPLSPEGQGWGLVPFSPLGLYEDGYAEFARLLRANMRHSGAMRIDHAMALLRLYWIPEGLPASEGAYVHYRVDDLFGIVALESHRARCVVIGEDLGTLPPGFRERLAAANLLSYRLQRFEREGGGAFIGAEQYPSLALASVGTHDLPPLAGYWHGDDITTRASFGWVTDRAQEDRERGLERERLVTMLTHSGDLAHESAGDFSGMPHEGQDLESLIAAAYRFVARTPSLIAMIQIEDLLGVRTSINIPGTTHQYPNWRHRLPVTIDELLASERVRRFFERMRALRPGLVPAS